MIRFPLRRDEDPLEAFELQIPGKAKAKKRKKCKKKANLLPV